MNLAFFGTPEVAATTLRALVAAGHDIRVVVTRKDTRRGRGGEVTPSPVKRAASELRIPVVHTAAEALGTGAELGVVVAYGRLIKPEILDQLPMVNIHFSLLPRWRGAAPVERAILAGDAVTGVCIMAVEEGLDTGPVYARQETVIGDEEPASQLRERLGGMGTALLLQLLHDGLPEPVAQEGEPTYAAKIEPDELELKFGSGTVACLRTIRIGRAWTTFRGRRFIVHQAAAAPCPLTDNPGTEEPLSQGPANQGPGLAPGQIHGDYVGTGESNTVLRFIEVQPEGKPRMSWADWARGARPTAGERFGS